MIICRARLQNTRLHNRNLRIAPADSWHQPDSIENQYYSKEWQKSDKKQSAEQCSQEYEENDISLETNIQTLNDDCLMHIFLQLPIVDRIRIERGKSYYILFLYILLKMRKLTRNKLQCVKDGKQ